MIPNSTLKNHYDYIIAGGGMAGLSLAYYLTKSEFLQDKSILIIDKEPKTKNDRTWCFWENETNEFEEIIYRKWNKVNVKGIDFDEILPTENYHYKMLRGKDDSKLDDRKTESYGINFNTNAGLIGGFVFRSSRTIGTFRDKPLNRYISLEVSNVKHPKEANVQITNNLILGKENYLFVIRPQYGREFTLFPKYSEGGINVSAILAAGPSIGLEKPYYIKYQTPPDNSVNTIPFTPSILEIPNLVILGSGSFFQGLTSSKIIPGINAKAALNFDVNTWGNSLTGFEFGFLAEWFTRRPEIMAYATNQQFFTSAYLTVYLGSKK